ncbi:hypothetical protein BKA70DRAFT_1448750 [Coprinopsis sp. MPI-PUGE-AT-0042]|nr:hypothetical protein BKA70DRAFT_1448750 [Coprinopsis sp. MPI-PUGE-AT-0042]
MEADNTSNMEVENTSNITVYIAFLSALLAEAAVSQHVYEEWKASLFDISDLFSPAIGDWFEYLSENRELQDNPTHLDMSYFRSDEFQALLDLPAGALPEQEALQASKKKNRVEVVITSGFTPFPSAKRARSASQTDVEDGDVQHSEQDRPHQRKKAKEAIHTEKEKGGRDVGANGAGEGKGEVSGAKKNGTKAREGKGQVTGPAERGEARESKKKVVKDKLAAGGDDDAMSVVDPKKKKTKAKWKEDGTEKAVETSKKLRGKEREVVESDGEQTEVGDGKKKKAKGKETMAILGGETAKKKSSKGKGKAKAIEEIEIEDEDEEMENVEEKLVPATAVETKKSHAKVKEAHSGETSSAAKKKTTKTNHRDVQGSNGGELSAAKKMGEKEKARVCSPCLKEDQSPDLSKRNRSPSKTKDLKFLRDRSGNQAARSGVACYWCDKGKKGSCSLSVGNRGCRREGHGDDDEFVPEPVPVSKSIRPPVSKKIEPKKDAAGQGKPTKTVTFDTTTSTKAAKPKAPAQRIPASTRGALEHPSQPQSTQAEGDDNTNSSVRPATTSDRTSNSMRSEISDLSSRIFRSEGAMNELRAVSTVLLQSARQREEDARRISTMERQLEEALEKVAALRRDLGAAQQDATHHSGLLGDYRASLAVLTDSLKLSTLRSSNTPQASTPNSTSSGPPPSTSSNLTESVATTVDPAQLGGIAPTTTAPDQFSGQGMSDEVDWTLMNYFNEVNPTFQHLWQTHTPQQIHDYSMQYIDQGVGSSNSASIPAVRHEGEVRQSQRSPGGTWRELPRRGGNDGEAGNISSSESLSWAPSTGGKTGYPAGMSTQSNSQTRSTSHQARQGEFPGASHGTNSLSHTNNTTISSITSNRNYVGTASSPRLYHATNVPMGHLKQMGCHSVGLVGRFEGAGGSYGLNSQYQDPQAKGTNVVVSISQIGAINNMDTEEDGKGMTESQDGQETPSSSFTGNSLIHTPDSTIAHNVSALRFTLHSLAP